MTFLFLNNSERGNSTKINPAMFLEELCQDPMVAKMAEVVEAEVVEAEVVEEILLKKTPVVRNM
jgi:hypothetical protein